MDGGTCGEASLEQVKEAVIEMLEGADWLEWRERPLDEKDDALFFS